MEEVVEIQVGIDMLVLSNSPHAKKAVDDALMRVIGILIATDAFCEAIANIPDEAVNAGTVGRHITRAALELAQTPTLHGRGVLLADISLIEALRSTNGSGNVQPF